MHRKEAVKISVYLIIFLSFSIPSLASSGCENVLGLLALRDQGPLATKQQLEKIVELSRLVKISTQERLEPVSDLLAEAIRANGKISLERIVAIANEWSDTESIQFLADAIRKSNRAIRENPDLVFYQEFERLLNGAKRPEGFDSKSISRISNCVGIRR